MYFGTDWDDEVINCCGGGFPKLGYSVIKNIFIKNGGIYFKI